MISIIRNQEQVNEGYLPFSYYKDNSILITKEGYLIKDEGLYWNDNPILIEIKSLYPERFSDLTEDIGFFMDEPIAGSLFSFYGLKCHKGKLNLELRSCQVYDSWQLTNYNPRIIIKKLKELLQPEFTYSESDYGCYDIVLSFEKNKEPYQMIKDFVEEAVNKLKNAEKLAILELTGFTWKIEYYNNELLYSKEVIGLLLRKMGFKKILYCHGSREYGKDFVFSEVDKFGNYVHYAMQVKSGDINGKVNGQIDELIGQIDDAFKIPFRRDNEQPHYISYFYIATSGKFTENAIEKLMNKIPRAYLGSVQIFDRERIIELLSSYCK